MRSTIALLAVLSAGLAGLAAAAQGPGAADNAAGRRQVLYLTHSAGYRHDVLPLSMEVLPRIGERYGFDVTATSDVSFLSPDRLEAYDAVVFFTTGELPIGSDEKAHLLHWVRSGHGFVGIHSATDTFYEWPEYGELIGAYFEAHPWHQEVTVNVEDPTHPATAHLGRTWRVTDEIYQFRNWDRAKRHVLLTLDTASVDLTKEDVKRTDGDFALAWTSTAGEGRVFYTALGHEAALWKDPAYQQHLAGGIRWALGLE